MLTVLDALSLAGSRAKQNDDALGWNAQRVFVLDGATDLHDQPIMPAASDAAWIAHFAAARFQSAGVVDPVSLIRRTSAEARDAFFAQAQAAGGAVEAWKLPFASLMMLEETAEGLAFHNLGDCRAFVAAQGVEPFAFGGAPRSKADEEAAAARFTASAQREAGLNYRAPDALEFLRVGRNAQNQAASPVLGVFPDCADLARRAQHAAPRGAHVVLASDGFAALVDTYAAYDAGGLITAAVERGLAALAVELRAIETADADSARHPRWKRSDDATAILVRVD